jgi:hypothetical protein
LLSATPPCRRDAAAGAIVADATSAAGDGALIDITLFFLLHTVEPFSLSFFFAIEAFSPPVHFRRFLGFIT